MCGSGRFLIPILENGIDIEGTDASGHMLDNCRKKCAEKNLNPVLYFQKLQDMSFKNKYGIVFIPSGSFGLITEENEINNSLKNIFDCLKQGGKFLLEIQTPYSLQDTTIISRKVNRNDFTKIILNSESRFEIRTNIEITIYEYRLVINNEVTLTESEVINVKHFYTDEFFDLLKSAGFSDIKALKPYSDKMADKQESMILFHCVKQI
jgi:SAM-dependent methyltransferase